MSDSKRRELAELVEEKKARARDLERNNKPAFTDRDACVQARDLMERSLDATSGLVIFLIIIGSLVAAALLHVQFRTLLPKAYPVPLGILLAGVLLMWPSLKFHHAFSVNRKLRRLRALPFTWNCDEFLAQLGEIRSTGTLVLRCWFHSVPDPATRKLFVETVATLSEGKMQATFETELVIRREAAGIFRGPTTRHTSGRRSFTNKRFLHAFEEAAGRILPRLGDVAPVARIDARIEGRILEGDENLLIERQSVNGERD